MTVESHYLDGYEYLCRNCGQDSGASRNADRFDDHCQNCQRPYFFIKGVGVITYWSPDQGLQPAKYLINPPILHLPSSIETPSELLDCFTEQQLVEQQFFPIALRKAGLLIATLEPFEQKRVEGLLFHLNRSLDFALVTERWLKLQIERNFNGR